jgi:hypothetical protein
MAAKTPIKTTFDGADAVGLAEFQAADFVDVADGGTGVVTLTSGGVLVGAGTSAVTTNKAAPSGDFVGTSDTQTLTNKTLTSPTIATPNVTTTLDMESRASLRFYETDNTNYVAFRSADTVASNLTWTLPSEDGADGHVLTTDGAGTLSFAAAGGGGGSTGYNNSTISTIPGKNGNFDLSYNVAQSVQETPFDSGATDPFGVNLGSVFTMMDPVGTVEDAAGAGLDLGVLT